MLLLQTSDELEGFSEVGFLFSTTETTPLWPNEMMLPVRVQDTEKPRKHSSFLTTHNTPETYTGAPQTAFGGMEYGYPGDSWGTLLVLSGKVTEGPCQPLSVQGGGTGRVVGGPARFKLYSCFVPGGEGRGGSP